MSQNRRNINPVAFLRDVRQLSFNRESAYGEKRPHIVPLGYIPPFQIVREPTDANINAIRLYKRADGTSQSITVDMFSTGFEILDFGTYKIWSYPGTIPIPASGIEEGHWYMTLQDGAGNVLTREDWCWRQLAAMKGMVKVEWFHQRNFPLKLGHINFEAPFKFWHWFATELGKPSYPYDRDVDERNGVEYVNKVVSWKEQRFVTRGDENLVDALSFLPHMDCVNVYFLGDEINTFKVLVTPEWEERGDEALVEVEIRSDQVTATFGDALENKDYSVLFDECIGVDFTAVALLNEGSLGYVGGYYVTPGGDTVNLVFGQYVLVKGLDTLVRLFVYQSPGSYFGALALATDVVVYDLNSGNYYVQHPTFQLSKPKITNVDTTVSTAYVVTGFAYPGTTIEIWGRLNSGSPDEELLGIFTEAELNSGATINPGLNEQFKIKASTWKCFIGESIWFSTTTPGIGEAEVGTNFEIG